MGKDHRAGGPLAALERRALWACALALLASLALGACARNTPKLTQVRVAPADLACDRDGDCVIRRKSAACCPGCETSVEPFAISTKASAAWDEACDGAECTLEQCERKYAPAFDAFVAVCANHICERRPAPS